MSVKSFLSFLLLAYFLIFSARSEAICVSIKSTQDILNCAINHHPDVQVSEETLKRDRALKKIAKQFQNPEIEAKVLSGQSNSDSVVNTEFNLSQTIELGGKRKNRIEQASAVASLTQAQVLESKELTALNTVLALYRLRQIRSELAALNEGMTTFQHTLEHFKSRPKLAPEQEVSATVFKLSLHDYKLKRAKLIQEQVSLQKFLELATGLPAATIQTHLPPSRRPWPKFNIDKNGIQNSALAKSQAEKTIAEANLKLAKSHAWPDFKLGPSFTTESGIPGKNTTAGANMILTLPIFSLNKGGIDYAKRDSYRAGLSYQLTLTQKKNERDQLLLRYRSALQSLGQLPLSGTLQNEHNKMENYYEQGLVPSSLVIETHRQIFEVTTAIHLQELTAIDALWRLYILDGVFLSKKI